MQYRDLGRTGVQVSQLCLGCMMFGGRTEENASTAIIDRAIDAGINFFDTANVYNRGRSEEVVGKVRYIGTSTYAAWQLVEALWVAKELGLNRFVSEQPPYHLLDRRIERELVPYAQTYGVALIPWSPLAGGFLTGKYRPGEPPPEGTRYAGREDERTRQLFAERAFRVLEVVQAVAREKGVTPSQVVLAWVGQQPGITAPIIGPRTMEQLEDNLGAVGVSLADDDLRRLDEVSPPGRAIVPYYEADFGPHRYRWV